MSEKNVELYRRLIEAFNAHDVEGVMSLCDPSGELHSAMTVPGGTVYKGPDGFRQYLRDMQDAWGDDVRAEPEAFFDLGEHTLMFYSAYARGRESGAEVAREAAAVARWRDSLIVYYKVYLNKEDALKALGVSEDTLEPIAP